MKRKYRSSARAGDSPREVVVGVSQTVPNQAMSVQTIIDRFVAGTLPNIYGEPVYSGDMEDYRDLDPVEKYDMAQEARREISDYKEKLRSKAEKDKMDKMLKDKLKEAQSVEPEKTD